MLIVDLLFLCACVAELCAVTKETLFTETNIAQVYFSLEKPSTSNTTVSEKKTYCIHQFEYEKLLHNQYGSVAAIQCKECDLKWVKVVSFGVGLVSKMSILLLILCCVLGVLFILIIFGVERLY
jgi:hypothetical protein